MWVSKETASKRSFFIGGMVFTGAWQLAGRAVALLGFGFNLYGPVPVHGLHKWCKIRGAGDRKQANKSSYVQVRMGR